MGSRTYIPKLLMLLHIVCTYIVRWRPQLNVTLTPKQEALLDAVYTACQAFTTAVEIEHGD